MVNIYFDKITAALLKIFNILVFVSLLITASFFLWIGQIQWAFDLYILLAIYLLFTKIEKLERG